MLENQKPIFRIFFFLLLNLMITSISFGVQPSTSNVIKVKPKKQQEIKLPTLTKKQKKKTRKLLKEKIKKDNGAFFSFGFSLLGLIPFIGIAFSVVSVLIGLRTLSRKSTDEVKVKGKFFAFLGVLLGFTGIILHIILGSVFFAGLI